MRIILGSTVLMGVMDDESEARFDTGTGTGPAPLMSP